jgi:CRISPR-associated endoribonuclease Cas6
MPVIIEFRLKPPRPLQPTTRQLHGLACALFEDGGDGHQDQRKPFAVWPLTPAPGSSGHEWLFRAAWLPDGQPPPAAAAPAELRIGGVTCAVTETAQRTATHAQLAAGTPCASADVEFRSPTYFSQNGTDVVLPDPRLIIGSWRRRWNASLPSGHALVVSDDTWQEIHRAARLTSFALRTETMCSGHDRPRAGFAGTARIQLAGPVPATAVSAFAALARFAQFCGTGAQTTHGFGATTLGSRLGSPDG